MSLLLWILCHFLLRTKRYKIGSSAQLKEAAHDGGWFLETRTAGQESRLRRDCRHSASSASRWLGHTDTALTPSVVLTCKVVTIVSLTCWGCYEDKLN